MKKINFENIFEGYLDAFSKLSPQNKKTKYDFFYTNSGLRRELYFLLKKKYNLKIIVPIRKFETFYPSKVIGRYAGQSSKENKKIINHGYLQDAWMHWKNKTIDYLILKKLFPKDIFIVKFEDFTKKSNAFYLRKICKFLKIDFSPKMKLNTSWFRSVQPNSSYSTKKNKILKKKLKVKKEIIPDEYSFIYKLVNKYSY